jgi:hypothetical protein
VSASEEVLVETVEAVEESEETPTEMVEKVEVSKETNEVVMRVLAEALLTCSGYNLMDISDLRAFHENTKVYLKTNDSLVMSATISTRGGVFTKLEIFVSEGYIDKTRLKYLIAHELGHYFDYMKDLESDQFKEICRDGEERLEKCGSGAFVRDYGMKDAYEDYADVFAYVYLENGSNSDRAYLEDERSFRKLRNPIREEKKEYFTKNSAFFSPVFSGTIHVF